MVYLIKQEQMFRIGMLRARQFLNIVHLLPHVFLKLYSNYWQNGWKVKIEEIGGQGWTVFE